MVYWSTGHWFHRGSLVAGCWRPGYVLLPGYWLPGYWWSGAHVRLGTPLQARTSPPKTRPLNIPAQRKSQTDSEMLY